MVALKTTSLSPTFLSSKRLDAPALAALAPVLRPRPHPTATMSFRVRLHFLTFLLPSYVAAVNGLWKLLGGLKLCRGFGFVMCPSVMPVS